MHKSKKTIPKGNSPRISDINRNPGPGYYNSFKIEWNKGIKLNNNERNLIARDQSKDNNPGPKYLPSFKNNRKI